MCERFPARRSLLYELMALFYRGAGPGSHSHVHDARELGFAPHFPGQTASVSRLIHHITRATTMSPYISFSHSYGVALSYAVVGPGGFATPEVPGYVYEVEISDDKECGVLDPVKEIARSLPHPWLEPNYRHDGEPTFLLGVVDPVNMRASLQAHCLFPPLSIGTSRTPHLSEQLEGMVRALRDAEILVRGKVPSGLVKCRYEVV
jgi:hypothetical protein